MFDMFDLIVKRRCIIVNEEDVMSFLKVMDVIYRNSAYTILMDMEIRNCGWKYEPEKWFIHFNMYDSMYRALLTALIAEGYQLHVDKHGDVYMEEA